ncbi:myc target protein 1 homolog [Latimeria chalumnae]|uniref:MYC target 1 n=1 Tax=Latimeria chalumnae TaxID=7897 RepID=H2ZT26_LATCH|nr:PREDICTED: myc target protein 1 [Latimeria chalumnae]|eukprot:XP_006012411.1 PREDICTED: myc target protein 1 [Latimeria chalumnae]
MANNTTQSPSELSPNFKDNAIISFCVSAAIGFVLIGFIWAVLTCLSRRKASAHITQTSANSRRSRASANSLVLNRTGFYRNSSYDRRSNLSLASAATLTFQRQVSLEQADPFMRKPSFRASTFHPFMQCNSLPRETDSNQLTLPRSNTASTINADSVTQPESHWSCSSLRTCHSSQTPPPAYETVIKAFQETCT